MMSSNDAERLLDENFIAMDDSFDHLDENNGYFAESNKYKKKKDLNFTSLWRKPKIGRRKTRSVGKQLVDSYDMTINEYDMPVDDDSKRGKVERGRESFDSFTSVPLSDFDNVKDNLAFLNLRSNNLNKTKSPKKNLNPKMFLTQPPVNRRDIKNKFKTKKKLEDEESRDIFKPIHNTNNDIVFDAFQIMPKESPNKTKPKEDAGKKQKEEEPEDLFDKENLPKESFYDGGLYQDHGPILSSLSEDTLHSDSIRGEQFLPDEMENWNPILSPKFEELEKDSWEVCDENNKMVVPRTETVDPVSRPAKVETSAGSFNDRLKLFQSKDTQPTEMVRSDPIKSRPISPKTTQLMEKYGVKATETEVKDFSESAVVPKKSLPDKIAPEVENCDKSVASAISKPDEQATAKMNEEPTSKAKSYSTLPYKSYVGNNRFKEMRTNTGTKFSVSSYQADSYKLNNEKKSFSADKVNDIPKKKILVPDSERTQSKAVDLSMLETFRTQATSKSIEKGASVAQQRNSTDASLCLEKEVEKESSAPNRFQRMSELSTHSTRSYSSNYRSSLMSQTSTYSKPAENKLKPEIEKVIKIVSSEGVTVASDESKDQSVSVDTEIKNTEMKEEEHVDSFRAARLRFGGKLPQRNKFERNAVSSIQRTASKEETSEEKKEATANSTQLSKSVAKKSFESLRSEANADRTSISSTGTQKSTVKSSFIPKSSFDPTPKKTNVGYKKPSLETSTPAANVLDATPTELENETGEKRETSNESTTNTSISTLTCDSAPTTTSFAQQSASIFGVTLSKRKKRVESASEPKESQATEKTTAINVVAKKSDVNTVTDKLETTSGASDPVKKELPFKEKQNNLNEEGKRRKISTSSVSIHSVEMKMKNETSKPKQEEKLRVVEKKTSVPRNVKPSSIANRLKMFEKPKVMSSDNDVDNIQDAAQSDSPKSVQSSESSSSFEVSSVATKRRDSDSGTLSECSEVKQVETSPYRKNIIAKGTDDFGERRRTLKSIRGTTSTSSFSKPRQVSRVFEKSEAHKKTNNTFGNDNSLRNRLSTLRALKSEYGEETQVEVPQKLLKSENKAESKVEPPKKSLKSEEKAESKVELPAKAPKETSAPTRDAYSMRRKFFENLDRKRVQASMSRPLITQTESMSTNNDFQKEHEIEIIGDGILHDNNDLPIMCVEFEEDFLLKDNISTCLSASENRSVVCKPDALLYSVSQRALGLMSQKAESNSLRSYGRTYPEEDKGTIDNGLKFNRFKSSGNIGSSSSNSELRIRFDRKNNEREVTDNAQEENKQTNKFRTSEFSQRSNRFAGNKVTSEVRRQSNDDDDAANDKKSELSIEGKKSIEKSTTVTTFNQPKDIGSMSISERLAFFESQRKKRSASTKKLVEKEEPTVLDNSRKSSVSQASSSSSFKNGIKKFRPSEASEMTPLAGASFADQSVSSRNLKRVSSTSMGTLDYSMNSSSYSRPSEVSKSSNTHGPSYSRFSRKGGYSSAAGNQSSTASASEGKKNSDLRCF